MMRVTFTLPNSLWVNSVHLVGEFNDWDRTSHPMARNQDGEWVIAVELPLGKAFQFRYLVDNVNWTNDDNADAYVRNFHGSDNFIVVTDPKFEKYQDSCKL